MSASLRDLMERAAADPSRPADAGTVWRRGRRRLWARRGATAAIAVSLVAGGWATVAGDVFSAREVHPARRKATVTKLRAYGQDLVVVPEGVWFSDRMGELVRIDGDTNARTGVVRDLPALGGGTVEIGGGALWTMAWNGTTTGSGRAVGAIQRVDLSEMRRHEVRRGEIVASFDDVGASVATPRGDHAPADAAYAFGSLWVADTAGDEVWRIDGRSGRLVERIGVGGAPLDVDSTSDRVWVLRGNVRGETGPATALVEVDPRAESPVVATLPVGGCANRIVADADSIWISDFCDGIVTRYDAATHDAATRSFVGGGIFGLAAGGGAVWALNEATVPVVARVDTATGRVTRYEIPGPRGQLGAQLAYGHGSLWIAGGNEAIRVDVPE